MIRFVLLCMGSVLCGFGVGVVFMFGFFVDNWFGRLL